MLSGGCLNHAKKAGLNPDPSLLLPIQFGASPERRRNLIRLQECLGFTSPGCLREPVQSPVDHLPAREIHGDDLGHVVVLNSLSGLEASQ